MTDEFDLNNMYRASSDFNTYNNLDLDINSFSNIHNYKIDIEPDEEEVKKEKLTEEEKEKIINESFPRGNKFSRIFTEIEKNYNDFVEGEPENMKISEDNIITFDLESTDPAESGRRLYRRKTISIRPNRITPLVGCNGVGKTTILRCLNGYLKSARYCYIYYDNLSNGAREKLSESAYEQNFAEVSRYALSSEGENILTITLDELYSIQQVLEGKITRNHLYQPYRDTDHVFILFDAIDSGSSVDNIINIKSHMNTLIEVAKKNNKNLYIIVAANSFELARKEICWDVFGSKEIEFGTDYEAYRKFIFGVRKKILKQWERMKEEN